MPSAILSGREPTRPTASRSVSDSVMPTFQPKPKLQRKKSNASLLYQGLGRGLSRVGSVMRRGGNSNNNSAPAADPQPSSSSTATSSVASSHTTGTKGRRAPKRSGSTTLQDLCEEAESAAERDMGARARAVPIKRSTPLSTYLPPPPPEKTNGVSRPFNVQHALHVTPDLDGLPSEWLESLKAQGRSASPTYSASSSDSSSRRSLSAPQERVVTVKRSDSLLGKLLDEIDSKSSRPPHATDSEDEEELERRLSEDLRGFHDIRIPGEDGWAASMLAAWDKDNTLVHEVRGLGPSILARRLTQDGPHRPQSVGQPLSIPSSSSTGRSPTPDASAYVGGLSKPRSTSSLAIPSVDVDDVDDSSSSYYVRRRSKSFDQHIVDRSTLYSPPPPPPHPQRNAPNAGDTPPTSFRSPHAGRLRASCDSFGVAHTISTRSSFIAASNVSQRSQESRYRRHSDESLEGRVQTDDSHTTPEPSPSRSSSELNLGTPPTSDMSAGGNASAAHSDTKDRSLIHERLSVASAIEAARYRTVSMPIGSVDPPSTVPVDHETRHLSLPGDHHGLIREPSPAPSSVESLNSTMAHPCSPTEEDFYDQYLGVGWCSACSVSQTQGIGNMPAASASALGLSLNTQLEHTCTLGLGRHASVRSQASSYGADRASVLSAGGTSQLSRMSSIASSTHSYNLHEVTVHRAYTRVLRRVPERSETQHSSEAPSEVGGGESEADMSASANSADNWYSARQSMQSGSSAISALEEAVWRVAAREGCV
ncbi:uncharacterized protein CcaverHIS019_0112320 [Cutaneotrichosporon cavernicola]|uniref:CRIB domain-containing protein n=1 Tax=Cutaneotrichosporon cavernicola TaxID=279322 RepID=A0AA48I2S4_9TREE|nr:uncharacterized protein CcaverHIS019_0112320 [Cutaneotrichosporon cavernicola]BEI88514.1 hypothetical protein CcaverHIS019_0112320 [Cutaneotrichosporon cavernicola]